MKILAIETSTNACSAVLLEGEQQDFSCVERFEMAPRQHTQLILPMIDSVLAEAGYDIKQMDALALGIGPGAFTGVRVATGVIQAIAYGADLPVAQISSLAALAQGVYREQAYAAQYSQLLVANDARMDEIYFGRYEIKTGFMTLNHQERVLKPEALESVLDASIRLDSSWTTIGNGWTVYDEALSTIREQCSELGNEYFYPHARDVAYLALRDVESANLVSAEQVSPIYLRDNVAKKTKKAMV
ncbi:tRNA (adenosine(37)-N6)-threonylcarbamoyltransferase complex dimerization subunit type 1 TsaB [sulfur-oxidizing endosymbiont of Gigantopelta aegis]|uniref:tRNA (adenosine(37)-N6)-threonylcarbamoyltransferase complex dimerization subunit type 1 TsaB n=1 Tax=sulfur-oxidizing endosymbiont of Gigantopelta aegis TaxID=2794934 RepID=UPI0018DDF872|nr:tRNA (adenosine(37)-N6)-threonylcarbamoyltransferase complex dimerization subunit type 1 TsaB [sulfur-oxidizing endosymbiont of Gigantopelta aegis]